MHALQIKFAWHAQLWLYSFPTVKTSTAQLWFHIWSACLWSGVNVFLRKIAVAAASSPAVEITQQEETLSIKTSTSVRTTNVSFTVGQSFSETTVDGRPCTVHVSLLQINQKTQKLCNVSTCIPGFGQGQHKPQLCAKETYGNNFSATRRDLFFIFIPSGWWRTSRENILTCSNQHTELRLWPNLNFAIT